MSAEASRQTDRSAPAPQGSSRPAAYAPAGRVAQRDLRAKALRRPWRRIGIWNGWNSEEQAMSEKLTVHDPRGFPPKVTGKKLAPRLQSLDGRVVYLVDCLFDNSEVFMNQLLDWFGEHLPAVDARIIKPRQSWVDDPDMRRKVEADGSAAILGVGL